MKFSERWLCHCCEPPPEVARPDLDSEKVLLPPGISVSVPNEWVLARKMSGNPTNRELTQGGQRIVLKSDFDVLVQKCDLRSVRGY